MSSGTSDLHADAVRVLTGWAASSSEEADLARKRTLELLGAGPVALTRAHRPGHVTASALVVDDDGRFLLCLHGRLNMWMQLGGHCEPSDASLSEAALREATEESGISGLIVESSPLDVDVHEVRCADDEGVVGPSAHYDVRYLMRAPAGSVEQISDESSDLAWFTASDLPSPLAPGVARQIAAATTRL